MDNPPEPRFGTDGIRGIANDDLLPDLALRLGAAAGRWLRRGADSAGRPRVIIGRDTRVSGPMLESALAAGLASSGVDAWLLGIVPTPTVSRVVVAARAAAGAIVSASHNPFPDNGIKLVGPDGCKLADAAEAEIAAILDSRERAPGPTGAGIGRLERRRDLVRHYLLAALATAPAPDALAGLRLVMDCANGAAYKLAPAVFRELGAEVDLIHADPDGVNINAECGSTRPNSLASRVRETGAQAGLAFDGDADRVILADEQGNIVDGDAMMAILGLHLLRSEPDPPPVVCTIMSNLGLEEALAAHGLRTHVTRVGDRYVAEAMEELGAAIGGEQSGHILLPRLTPTGDGLVTAVQVLSIMRQKETPLSCLASVMRRYPQVLRSIRVERPREWSADPALTSSVQRAIRAVGREDWVSVRPSGTESLLRIMVQGRDREPVEAAASEIERLAMERLGGARGAGA